MKRKKINRLILLCLFLLEGFLIFYILWLFFQNNNVAVLNSAGYIGRQERDLIFFAVLLGMIVLLPTFALTFFIIWKYREGNHNKKIKYSPDWDHNNKIEFIWWAIPCVIIFILSVITWESSHSLDPYKAIKSNAKPIIIDVVALDWKWLFIYPKQGIATVNLVELPKSVPIKFYITSDAPMNSFWIPNLGGQIYAMPGMSTQLNLIADKAGNFPGYSANISGKGFSGMTFTTMSVSQDEFETWVNVAKQSSKILNQKTYNQLAKPSENNPVIYYSSVDENLYNNIIYKYMIPATPATNKNKQPMQMNMNGMKM